MSVQLIQAAFDSVASESVKKSISDNLSEFKYVYYESDDGEVTLMYLNDLDDLVWSGARNRYVFKEGSTPKHRCSSFEDDEMDDCTGMFYESYKFKSPEYRKITVADLLSLPIVSSDTSVGAFSDAIEDEVETSNRYFDSDTIYSETVVFKTDLILKYTQGDDGKYGQELHVVYFGGNPVALMSVYGKWTSDKRLDILDKSGYDDMIRYVKDNFTKSFAEEVVYDKHGEYDLGNNLSEIYFGIIDEGK